LLSPEETGFRFSKQGIRSVGEFLTPLYQHLRRGLHLLRRLPYLGGQDRATEDMCAHTGGKVRSAPSAEVRASAKGIRSELHHAELKIAGRTFGDGMIRAVHE